MADLGCVMPREFTALQEVVEACIRKRRKPFAGESGGGFDHEQHKVSHIMVERNRRKQMTENLTVLRALTPCFYVKRGVVTLHGKEVRTEFPAICGSELNFPRVRSQGDQASIIGGVVDYITELQRVLQSLEAKKQRKDCCKLVTIHRTVSSPKKPRLSPRPSVPISPRTPQPTSPYRPVFAPFIAPSLDICSNELAASSRSAVAEVEVNFVGGNLLLKTCSSRIPGKTTKVIAVLENLSLEVVHVDISVVDETMVNSFTIKIGVECRISVEELAQHIQQTFC